MYKKLSESLVKKKKKSYQRKQVPHMQEALCAYQSVGLPLRSLRFLHIEKHEWENGNPIEKEA